MFDVSSSVSILGLYSTHRAALTNSHLSRSRRQFLIGHRLSIVPVCPSIVLGGCIFSPVFKKYLNYYSCIDYGDLHYRCPAAVPTGQYRHPVWLPQSIPDRCPPVQRPQGQNGIHSQALWVHLPPLESATGGTCLCGLVGQVNSCSGSDGNERWYVGVSQQLTFPLVEWLSAPASLARGTLGLLAQEL